MDREVFEHRFIEATRQAREFAQGFIEESLPDAMRFHVHLNRSHDANAGAAFQLFPEDSRAEVALRTKYLSASDVVELLRRNGAVPQWRKLGRELGRE
jgi:hypothetical protein